MRRARPNLIIILSIVFGVFLIASGTSQLVDHEQTLDHARSASLYSYNTVRN